MIGILARFRRHSDRNGRPIARAGILNLIMLVEIVFLIAVIMDWSCSYREHVKCLLTTRSRSLVTTRLGARNFLPLKVNAAGVMPIIFAQAILFPANHYSQVLPVKDGQVFYGSYQYYLHDRVLSLCDCFSFLYTAAYIQSKTDGWWTEKKQRFHPR